MNDAKSLPKRNEVDHDFKWKLEDIYADINNWEEDFKKVKELSDKITLYKGRLSESAATLLECFNICDELQMLNDKLFVYSRMKLDENNAESRYQSLSGRAMTLSTEIYAKLSFIVPELTKMPESQLKEYVATEKGLMQYNHYIEEILRQKKHILSEQEEELLALSSDMAQAARDAFTMYNNADIKFPFINDEKGEEIELTKGRYIKFLESKDRKVRASAFKAMYETYGKVKNTLASTLISNIKKNIFYKTARKYPSSLEMSLDSDNISSEVYDKLIEAVNKNLHYLNKYLKLRKRVLNVDELHMYDLYVPIVEQPEKNIPYSEAVSTVENGLSALGEEYLSYLRAGMSSGWIDVYENEGKTSGAYAWGSYLTHPFVLLNYQGTINDVFTLAHEMGHALHSFYTNKTQPYIYSEYKIFVAEVASTVNESLLNNYLLANTKDQKERAYLLNNYLEEFRGTMFRQVMFAEFEKIIHEKSESGESLTADALCEIYLELNKKYFSDEVCVDPDIALEWARIPHFYSSFYVYKYATGFSAAVALSQQILKEGKPAVDRYIEFLSSGGSDYPLELLKKAGVDLSTPEPVEEALELFGKLVDELEALL